MQRCSMLCNSYAKLQNFCAIFRIEMKKWQIRAMRMNLP